MTVSMPHVLELPVNFRESNLIKNGIVVLLVVEDGQPPKAWTAPPDDNRKASRGAWVKGGKRSNRCKSLYKADFQVYIQTLFQSFGAEFGSYVTDSASPGGGKGRRRRGQRREG